MLTPSFDVSQDSECVTITIRVPYVKISEAEIDIEGSDFKFYCKPYFLHLLIPGQLKRDGHEKSSYDPETSTVMVTARKVNYGEHFANLEMLTMLLPCKTNGKIISRPLIEVIGEEKMVGEEAGEEEKIKMAREEEDFDWRVEQSWSEFNKGVEQGVEQLCGLMPYGFALQHSAVFIKLQEELPSIVDCPDPDHMTPYQRRKGRVESEDASFNEAHYLADLMDNDYINVLISFEPPWRDQLTKWKSAPTEKCRLAGEPSAEIVPFTATQRDQLKELSNRDYLLDKATKRSLYLGLVDIIFAYAYNHRSTEGEGSVESAWTICKLSSTLSWLDVFHGGVHEVIYYSIRRALSFPLYRHWKLSLSVLQDTRDLFRLGRRKLLQCMLDVRNILNSCEPYYILNDLYITDYTIWLQKASAKQMQRLADELDEVTVDIGSIGWELEELKEAALMTMKEAEELRPDKAEIRGEGAGYSTNPILTGLSPSNPATTDIQTLTEQLQVTSLSVAKESPVKPLMELINGTNSQLETSSENTGTNSQHETSSENIDSDGTGSGCKTSSENADGDGTSSECETSSENGDGTSSECKTSSENADGDGTGSGCKTSSENADGDGTSSGCKTSSEIDNKNEFN